MTTAVGDARHAGLSPALVEAVAGLTAGSAATLVVHPLDIVKTRMQSELRGTVLTYETLALSGDPLT